MIRKLWIIALLLAISCGSANEKLPRIRYGEETCDHCRMIISEKRFAAAYKTESGDLRKFDDLGCAFLHREAQAETTGQFWGYDYEETAWLDVTQAFFVHSSDLPTPMGYGIAALTTKEKAEDLAERVHGQVLPLDQLQQILQP